MTTNRRAAEAMALDDWRHLSPAQQRHMLGAWPEHCWPRVHYAVRHPTLTVLRRMGLVCEEDRDLTIWGRFVLAAALVKLGRPHETAHLS